MKNIPIDKQAKDALSGNSYEERKLFNFNNEKVSYNDLRYYLHELNDYCHSKIDNTRYRIVLKKITSQDIVACLQFRRFFIWLYCSSYESFAFRKPFYSMFWFMYTECSHDVDYMKRKIDYYQMLREKTLASIKEKKERNEALKRLNFRVLTLKE